MAITAAQLVVKIGADVNSLTRGMKTANDTLGTFAKKATVTGTLLTGAITVPAVAAAKGMLDVAMSFEQSRIAFTTMLGSGERATKFLNEMREFAKSTPFEFTDLQQAARRLMAFGFAAEDVLPMMRDIGDAVSGLGMGADGVDRVTLALGQMQAKSKVSAQEMLQLTEAGIPAWRYLAESMGLSTQEVMKLSERGLIPAGQAIQAILAGMRGDFGGLMAAQAKTAAGQISSLKDELNLLATDLGTELLPVWKDLIQGARDAVSAFADLPLETQKNILSIGGLVAAIGPAMTIMGGLAGAARGLIGVVGALPGILTGISAAVKTWGANMVLTTALGAAGLSPLVVTLGAAALAAGALAGVFAAVNKHLIQTNREGAKLVDSAWQAFFLDQVSSGKSAAEVLAEYKTAQERVNQQLKDAGALRIFIANQKELKGDLGGLNLALAQSAQSYTEYLNAVYASGEPLSIFSQAEYNAARALIAVDEAVQQVEFGNLIEGLNTGAAASDWLANSARDNVSELQTLIGTYDDLKAKMDNWVSGTAADVEQMLGQKFPESSQLYRDALKELDDVMGTDYTNQLELKDAVQGLVDQYARTKDLEGFRTGLQDIKDQGLADMKSELEDVTTKAGELYEKLLDLPEDIKIKINFDVESLPSWLTGALGGGGAAYNPYQPPVEERALGGSAWAGQLYQVNERRKIEYFIPNQNGRIIPLGDGEQQAAQGGTVNVYATVQNSMDWFQVGNVLRRQLRRGEL